MKKSPWLLGLIIAGLAYGAGFWQGATRRANPARAVVVSAPIPADSMKLDDDAAQVEDAAPPDPETFRGRWTELCDMLTDIEGRKKFDFPSLVKTLSSAELTDLLAVALAHPDQKAMSAVVAYAARALGESDFDAAIGFFSSQSVAVRKRLDSNILRGMTQADPARAWAWLRGLPDQAYGNYALARDVERMQGSMVYELTKQDPELAMNLARQIEDPRVARNLIGVVAAKLVKDDPDQALTALSGDTMADQIIVNALVKSLAETNPATALAWLQQNPDMASTANVASVADGMLLQGDMAGVDSFYAGMTDADLRNAIAGQAALRSIRDNPGAAVDWISQIQGARDQANAAVRALRELPAESNFGEQAGFVEAALPGNSAARYSVMLWTASRFKDTAPQAIAAYANRIAADEPKLSAELLKRYAPSVVTEGDGG